MNWSGEAIRGVGGAPRLTTERDGVLVDRSRGDRELPFTVWLPEGSGRHALVLYSHASYGHRRQSSFLMRHLADHGYVAAGVDHTVRPATDGPTRLRQMIDDRVPDLRFLLDQLLSRDLARRIDTRRIGLVGWSFGGWAVHAMPEVDARIRAIVALAPAGSRTPLPGIIPATLTFDWQREVPTLFLAAERDRFIPPAQVEDVFERTRSPKRLVVLAGADHSHFSDEVGDESVCSANRAHEFTRSHALAHFNDVFRAA